MSLSRIAALTAMVLPNFAHLAEPLHTRDELLLQHGQLLSVESEVYESPVVHLDGEVSGYSARVEELSGTIDGYAYCMTDEGRVLYVTITGTWERNPEEGTERVRYTSRVEIEDTDGSELDMVNVAQKLQECMERKGLSQLPRLNARALMDV